MRAWLVFVVGQGAGNTANPQFHTLANLGRYFALDDYIGDGEAAARLEHAESLLQHASLSAERLMTQLEMITSTELSGSGICSISPFRNSTLDAPALRLFSSRQGEHFVGHVQAVRFARGADPRAQKAALDAAAGAEVEHRSPGCRSASAVGLPQPKRGLQRSFRHSPA